MAIFELCKPIMCVTSLCQSGTTLYVLEVFLHCLVGILARVTNARHNLLVNRLCVVEGRVEVKLISIYADFEAQTPPQIIVSEHRSEESLLYFEFIVNNSEATIESDEDGTSINQERIIDGLPLKAFDLLFNVSNETAFLRVKLKLLDDFDESAIVKQCYCVHIS